MGSGAPLWIWHTTRIPIVLPQKTLRFYPTFPRQGGARCFCLRKGVIEATKGMVSLPSLNSCQVFQLLTAAEFPALFHQCCQCLYMSRGFLCESMLEYILNQHPPFICSVFATKILLRDLMKTIRLPTWPRDSESGPMSFSPIFILQHWCCR